MTAVATMRSVSFEETAPSVDMLSYLAHTATKTTPTKDPPSATITTTSSKMATRFSKRKREQMEQQQKQQKQILSQKQTSSCNYSDDNGDDVEDRIYASYNPYARRRAYSDVDVEEDTNTYYSDDGASRPSYYASRNRSRSISIESILSVASMDDDRHTGVASLMMLSSVVPSLTSLAKKVEVVEETATENQQQELPSKIVAVCEDRPKEEESKGKAQEIKAKLLEGKETVQEVVVKADQAYVYPLYVSEVIGIYSTQIGGSDGSSRKARIARFHQKRHKRKWEKKIKYNVRKEFADSRIRVKGRFLKKGDELLLRDVLAVI